MKNKSKIQRLPNVNRSHKLINRQCRKKDKYTNNGQLDNWATRTPLKTEGHANNI